MPELFAGAENGITFAHNEMISQCDIGDVVLMGDSVTNAGYLPDQIGPNVRVLSMGGSSPIESYYILHNTLANCAKRPKALILVFTPYRLHPDALTLPDSTFLWSRGVETHSISYDNLLDLLATTRKIGNSVLFGPASLFDLDAIAKAYLYTKSFPAYYFGSIINYFDLLLTRNETFFIKKNNITQGFRRYHINNTLYKQTLAEHGHHFYGTSALDDDETQLDHDSELHNYAISPLMDFFIRRTIREFNQLGIEVYLEMPPRNEVSAKHYHPEVPAKYYAYYKTLEAEEKGVHLLEKQLPVWPATFFGDSSHLNHLGAMTVSDNIRLDLSKAGHPEWVYSQEALVDNIQRSTFNVDILTAMQSENNLNATVVKSDTSEKPNTFQELKSDVANLTVINNSEPLTIRLSPQAANIKLARNTEYVSSIFVKITGKTPITWTLQCTDHFNGAITWNPKSKKSEFFADADTLNSGIDLCADNWVRLWIRAKTPESVSQFEGNVLSLAADATQNASLFGYNLEQAQYPANNCINK
jgi:hypothetical protein